MHSAWLRNRQTLCQLQRHPPLSIRSSFYDAGSKAGKKKRPKYFRLFHDDSLSDKIKWPDYFQRWRKWPAVFDYKEFWEFSNENLYARNYSALEEIMDAKVLKAWEMRLKQHVPPFFLENLNLPASRRSYFCPQILDVRHHEEDRKLEVKTYHQVGRPPFEARRIRKAYNLPSKKLTRDAYHGLVHSIYVLESNFRYVKERDKDWIITGINYFY